MRPTHSIQIMKLAWDVLILQTTTSGCETTMKLIERLSDEITEPEPVKKGDSLTIHWDLGSFLVVATMDSYPEDCMWCVCFGPDTKNEIAMWNGEQWELGVFGKPETLDLTLRGTPGHDLEGIKENLHE